MRTTHAVLDDTEQPSRAWSTFLALRGRIAFALSFRFACYAAMTALALWGETRVGATLHDEVLARLPYVAWVDRLNYVAWLALYLPLSIALFWTEPGRWCRYMITGGLVSLARGVCIAATSLGTPDPSVAGAGIGSKTFAQAYLELLSPIDVFANGSIKAYLSQDLFFSGHVATTFLLLLYVWHRPHLRALAIVAHLAMVAAVLLARLHYSIDVLGAWAFTFAIFAAREWRPKATVSA